LRNTRMDRRRIAKAPQHHPTVHIYAWVRTLALIISFQPVFSFQDSRMALPGTISRHAQAAQAFFFHYAWTIFLWCTVSHVIAIGLEPPLAMAMATHIHT
jgi:hypothetical protein